MGFIDYTDRYSIKSLSALIPDKQYAEAISKRMKWYCWADLKCYDARDFIDSETYAREVWSQYQEVTIAFSTTLWAVDLAAKFVPKLA
jgi:hypothetical protein